MECAACGLGGHPLDERLGVEGSASRGAERLICLVCGNLSFEAATLRLKELLGWTRSANTLGDTCYRHAERMQTFREEEPEAVRPFREAAGDIEFETDGTCVNTREGWKEVRLAIFAKRPRGPAATPEQWDSRKLPAPLARCAFAALERAVPFGRRWKRWSRRLGVLDPRSLTVLGDGAKWIWEQQLERLPGAEGGAGRVSRL
jgi:hypothetical protein